MNINSEWAKLGMETETDNLNDGDLIDSYYEKEAQSKHNPDLVPEVEDLRAEIDRRGIIAKKYTGNELFKEETVNKITEEWIEKTAENTEGDDSTQVGMFKTAESNPMEYLSKVPDTTVMDSYYLLKEKQDKGITSLEDETSLAELEVEMKRRKLASTEGAVEELVGNWQGLSDGDDISDIADRWGVPVAEFSDQLEQGMEVEQEHTHDEELAKKIALDHLVEDKDYYKKLKRIESICDKLEENRYYCGNSEEVIEKTAQEMKEDRKVIAKIYWDRYIQ
jgi:hypothetical protein